MNAPSTKHCRRTLDAVSGWASLIIGVVLALSLVHSHMGSAGEAGGVPGALWVPIICAIVALLANAWCGIACPGRSGSVSRAGGAPPAMSQ